MAHIEKHATNLVDVLYGNEKLQFDDVSENWFEATKIYRNSMAWDAPGVSSLLRSETLQMIATRASKRFDDLPLIELPEPMQLQMSLDEVIESRRSAESYSGKYTDFAILSTILQKSYGVIERDEGLRRPVPSGGALYPLDLYIIVNKVNDLEKGIYHFDPYRNGIVNIGSFNSKKFGEIFLQEEAVKDFSFTIVVSANFWRSRFKYGPRSYRFTFLEAGHVVQNMILIANSLNISTRPYGGFIDNELTDMIGIQNGIDDAPIYSLVAGSNEPV